MAGSSLACKVTDLRSYSKLFSQFGLKDFALLNASDRVGSFSGIGSSSYTASFPSFDASKSLLYDSSSQKGWLYDSSSSFGLSRCSCTGLVGLGISCAYVVRSMVTDPTASTAKGSMLRRTDRKRLFGLIKSVSEIGLSLAGFTLQIRPLCTCVSA